METQPGNDFSVMGSCLFGRPSILNAPSKDVRKIPESVCKVLHTLIGPQAA